MLSEGALKQYANCAYRVRLLVVAINEGAAQYAYTIFFSRAFSRDHIIMRIGVQNFYTFKFICTLVVKVCTTY